jgi:asparagine synthase (glutamine-hydrolysing)
MCGITGIFDLTDRRPVNRALLEAMNQTQFHRGPDEGGVHLEPGVGLAHRRLSIIDLSSGQQPLFNEDETVVVTYNGEIYNFPELTEELKQAGHTFRTHCDTEVIVHAWEEWGEACVERFRGMFAFGLWDRNRETLFLARDRLGIKPLYYAACRTASSCSPPNSRPSWRTPTCPGRWTRTPWRSTSPSAMSPNPAVSSNRSTSCPRATH